MLAYNSECCLCGSCVVVANFRLHVLKLSSQMYRLMMMIIIMNFNVGHHGLFRFRILTSEIYISDLNIW